MLVVVAAIAEELDRGTPPGPMLASCLSQRDIISNPRNVQMSCSQLDQNGSKD